MQPIELPANLMTNPIALMLIFAAGGILKEVVVAVLHGLAKRWKSDKDPTNDTFADGVEAAANAVDKIGLPKFK